MRIHVKHIWWAVPIMALVIFATAIYIVWNKPHGKVENRASVAVNAESIYNEYSTNESAADSHYLNKVLEVKGKVVEVSNNQDQKTVALLEVSDPLGGIQCTMRDDGVKVQKNDQITVKGFCNGYTTAVILDDCILMK